ncbi:hypothetical protein T11_7902 [Trichinella zimbabwensis]|uniref:Uncharacterized protein n=1 Tax=Trichinella zimbabwensis TaxID=268475 RepID=A0A0V1GFI6_9BILA|nr:hypothetical protein T11_7902 [Trichinella zimbabwensis]
MSICRSYEQLKHQQHCQNLYNSIEGMENRYCSTLCCILSVQICGKRKNKLLFGDPRKF